MKEQFHSRIAKLLVVLALAVVASVMFVFVGCAPQEEEPAPEHTHTWETVTEDPTCGTDGYTYQECSCGEERNYRVLPATGEHEWETVTENATCTSNGYTVQVCKNCGTESNRTSIAALGHDYEVVEEGAVAATCTTSGYHFEECTRCHDRKQITDPALGHDLVAGTPVAATCTTNGYTPYECSRCDYVEQRNMTEKLDHDFGELTQYIPEDCTQDGYWYQECKNCGYPETSDRIPAKGHMIDFDAATTKITPLTCEADGSVQFVCEDCDRTVTATADQIANGDFRVENLPLSNPTVAANAAPVYYYDTVNFGKDANYPVEGPDPTNFSSNAFADTEAGRAEAAKYFLQSYGHDYADANKFVCKEMTTSLYDKYETSKNEDEEYNKLWNYCERCEEEFALQDHTMPAGALPCVTMAKNPNYTKDELEAFEDEGYDIDKYAYYCTVCEQGIEDGEHEYVVKHLDAGSVDFVNGDYVASKDAVWSDATSALDCTYYYVCACGEIIIAQPHNTDGKEATCTDAVYCTVCDKLIERALGHDDLNTKGTFGDYKSPTIAATCTEPAYDIYRCQRCADREKADEDVKWVEGENYKFVKVADSNPKGHSYKAETVFDATSTAVGCARPSWQRDVCTVKGCGHVRVAEKPTVYTLVGENQYVEVTEALVTGTADTYYWIKGGKYVALTAEEEVDYNAGTYTAEYDHYQAGSGKDFDYTDANGLYDYSSGGTHQWVAQKLDYTDPDYSANFVPLTCTTENGRVLYQCKNCGEFDWRSISLGNYYILMNDLTDNDIDTLKDSLDGFYKDEDINKLTELEDVAAAVALTKKAYHTEDMLGCGHALCDDCVPADSIHDNIQWQLSFITTWDQAYVTDVELPTIDTYTGYVCRTAAYNQEKLQALKAELLADTNYSYAMYWDARHTDLVTEEEWAAIGVDTSDNDQYEGYRTIYVVVTPKNAAKLSEDLAWMTFANDQDGKLNVGFQFNNNFIPVDELDSISIQIIDTASINDSNPGETVLATALSTNANGSDTLENLLEVATGGTPWMDKDGWCGITVGWFLAPAHCNTANRTWSDPEDCWTGSYAEGFMMDGENDYCDVDGDYEKLTGVTLRVTFTMGNSVVSFEKAQ